MNSLNHVGVTVSDIARSARFLGKLGFEPEEPEVADVATDWIRTMTGYPDARVKIAYVRLGSFTIELISYTSPRGQPQAVSDLPDCGNTHIAITVPDLGTAYERLSGEGVEFLSAPIHVEEGPFAGARGVYIRDPDGNVLELNQG
jgi:catechol 2,3-dioxygenase-like lactoylglutathione lyase family enzyme